MKIYTICKNCKKSIRIKGTPDSRFDIVQKFGKTISIDCKKCNHKYDYGVEKVKARNHLVPILSIILFFTISIIEVLSLIDLVKSDKASFYLIPVAISIPLIVSITWIRNENKKIKLFNRS